ncbi:cytochrome c3 family protein [Shewanella pneumatophori]|uniref:Cytochrome c3 family protein n=1 Tax=Shewanella pneumatophori TaxID=314092 RepID=A0A9X2CDN2_9GAMM|nr:cytochrome c3 family protein [Shewanella pneumatophori]MCL1138122.1 cytochrome c3 family protein [Shewanella pneumatophori]
MLKVLGLTVLLSFSAAATAASVADTHTEMAGCESCHADGAPSSDMAFENEACITCHGSLKELEGEMHTQHDGIITCSDCHVVHEEASANDSCANCH